MYIFLVELIYNTHLTTIHLKEVLWFYFVSTFPFFYLKLIASKSIFEGISFQSRINVFLACSRIYRLGEHSTGSRSNLFGIYGIYLLGH
jgi:hypothetical protein